MPRCHIDITRNDFKLITAPHKLFWTSMRRGEPWNMKCLCSVVINAHNLTPDTHGIIVIINANYAKKSRLKIHAENFPNMAKQPFSTELLCSLKKEITCARATVKVTRLGVDFWVDGVLAHLCSWTGGLYADPWLDFQAPAPAVGRTRRCLRPASPVSVWHRQKTVNVAKSLALRLRCENVNLHVKVCFFFQNDRVSVSRPSSPPLLPVGVFCPQFSDFACCSGPDCAINQRLASFKIFKELQGSITKPINNLGLWWYKQIHTHGRTNTQTHTHVQPGAVKLVLWRH